MLKTVLSSAAAAASVAVGPVAADTIIVPEEQPTIEAALSVATDGDSIFVAAGTYHEADLTIEDADISIFGEIDSEGAPLVTIDGQGAGIIFVVGANGSEGATIENFNFTGANTCIWIYHVAPTIRNCTFSGLDAAIQGAGIWLSDSRAVIESCRFEGNTAAAPGSLLFCKSNTPEVAPTVRNCTFANNLQPSMVVSDCNPTLENCVFADNTSSAGGGISLFRSAAVLSGCTFTRNQGGGLVASMCDDLQVLDCVFDANLGQYGSGMQIRNSLGGGPVLIERCQFLDHTESQPGSPTELGSAINTSSIDLVVRECTFTGNDTSSSVIFAFEGTYEVEGCTFENNIEGVFGPGPCCDFYSDVTLFINDCEFEGNSGSGVSVGGFSTASISNCCFSDNTAWYTAGLTIVQVDATVDNCQFRRNVSEFGQAGAVYFYPGSLVVSDSLFCENLGDPDDIEGPWSDGGGNTFSETCAPPCPGDVNDDGVVDGTDLSQVLGFWGACASPADCHSDINGDGITDGADLSMLLGGWGSCPQ